MNSDEIKSLIIKVLLVVLSPLATKYHIDGNLAPAFAADIADVIVLGYGVYIHWNMKKVPETATAVALPAVPGVGSGPLPVGGSVQLASGAAVKVVGALLIGILILHCEPAFAQKKDSFGVPGGIVHVPIPLNSPAAAASGSTDVLAQLRAKFTADVTTDLNSALALAQQVPAGCSATPPTTTACTAADTTAVPCYQALISLNGVINSYTPPTDKPHVISDLEQLRIVARTVQSTNFKDACAPLVQDISSQANQLVASVLGIISGAAKIGIAIP